MIVSVKVANHTVRRIHSQNMASALEEADFVLRTALFEYFKKENDFAGRSQLEIVS